jgi:carnitine-CoA ligase
MPWAEMHEFPASTPPEMTGRGEAVYLFLPAFHAAGRVLLYGAVLSHARTIIREGFSITEFWNDVVEHNVTSLGIPGPIANFLLEIDGPDQHPLRRVMMGPLIPRLDEFTDRFGVDVSTAYGMTEIGVPLASDGFDLANGTSCGRVRDGYEVRVVNEHDEPVGPDEVGELIVRHRYPWRLNAGYWHMPEQTAEAWRNGWFHTGDGFRHDDEGNYYFVDRLKDTIRRRGENISSFEVEAYVAQHPDVIEVAAVAVPADVGEDEVKVIVFADDGLTPQALIEFLIPQMPRFMVPRYVELVDDELPKTDTLRVKKVMLRTDEPINDRTWDREAAGVVLPKG